jgi:hypothetical protein
MLNSEQEQDEPIVTKMKKENKTPSSSKKEMEELQKDFHMEDDEHIEETMDSGNIEDLKASIIAEEDI